MQIFIEQLEFDYYLRAFSDFLTTFNVYSHSDESAKKNEMDYITSCFTDLFDSSNEE
ncbi:hypothetical protein [Ruminococcus sp.]|uniref:hypothetical protein n=1 Tax=Ruminococcus sp. TaxID=41978 RepID=UPI0025E7518D|nr:hypothetical protein [Ruminococcus sp.]MCR4637739.1 hypothetical protein [Ruminococcus sp.]